MTLKIQNEKVLETLPSVVVFDLDNTFYPYTPAHQAGMVAAETKICERLGVDAARFRKNFAVARRVVKDRLEGTASSHNRLLYFQTLLEQMGLNSQVLLALDLEQTYWRAFLGNARIFPDAKEFLRDLRSAGIRTAVLTDLTARIQFRKLVYFGLDQQFDTVVTSEEAGADKPDREMFELLLQKLQVENPSGVWMIGDNAATDMCGARNLGMVAVQKLHSGVKSAVGENAPDISFEHFIDLRRLWKKAYDIGDVPSRFSFRSAANDPGYA